MNAIEYNKRVSENTQEYLRQLSVKSFDAMKFHGFDALAGDSSRFLLAKKMHDVLGAVLLGFLPYLREHTGADAVKLENNIFVDVEIKTSYTDINNLFKTKRGSVYSTKDVSSWPGRVPKNKTCLLKSCFNATYKIVNNLTSKFKDTYFIAVDSIDDSVIECYSMDHNAITTYLNGRVIPDSGSLQIKLVEFMNLGTPALSIVNTIGFDTWKKSLLPSLQEKEVFSKPRPRKVKLQMNIPSPSQYLPV